MNDPLEDWLKSKPETVKLTARKYPPGTMFNIHGKCMWVVAYEEDGAIKVSAISPYEDYERAIAERVPICTCCVQKLDSLRSYMNDKHYRVIWTLRDGSEVVGTTMHPTKEDAQKEIDDAFRRRENWSQAAEIRECCSFNEPHQQ